MNILLRWVDLAVEMISKPNFHKLEKLVGQDGDHLTIAIKGKAHLTWQKSIYFIAS